MQIGHLAERIERSHQKRHLEVGEYLPLLLYINIPFCGSRCIFCDWVTGIPNAQLLDQNDLQTQYINALVRQIDSTGPLLNKLGYRVRHVYWGGGTPTRLSAASLKAIGNAVKRSFDLAGCQSYTMEASPETLNEEKLSAAYEIGVRRISLGAQSFSSESLKRSGRIHSVEQVFESIRQIRKSPIKKMNIDLLVGLPGEEIPIYKQSIERITDILPEHLSLYFCRISPKTQLARSVARGRLKPASAECMIDSYLYTAERLQMYGYTETLMGYFARGSENKCLSDAYYFGMEGEIFGLGSGAFSVIAHHYLRSSPGEIESYIRKPDSFDSWFEFSASSGNWIPFLHPPFWSEDGLVFDKFEQLLGFPFQDIRENAIVRGLLQEYENHGAVLIEDGGTIKMTPATRTIAYIKWLVNHTLSYMKMDK